MYNRDKNAVPLPELDSLSCLFTSIFFLSDQTYHSSSFSFLVILEKGLLFNSIILVCNAAACWSNLSTCSLWNVQWTLIKQKLTLFINFNQNNIDYQYYWHLYKVWKHILLQMRSTTIHYFCICHKLVLNFNVNLDSHFSSNKCLLFFHKNSNLNFGQLFETNGIFIICFNIANTCII